MSAHGEEGEQQKRRRKGREERRGKRRGATREAKVTNAVLCWQGQNVTAVAELYQQLLTNGTSGSLALGAVPRTWILGVAMSFALVCEPLQKLDKNLLGRTLSGSLASPLTHDWTCGQAY